MWNKSTPVIASHKIALQTFFPIIFFSSRFDDRLTDSINREAEDRESFVS